MLLPFAVMAQPAKVDYQPMPPASQPVTALKAVKPVLTQQQAPASEPQKMPYPTQNDNSPKPVTNLRWECVPYTLTGSLLFTMPTQTIYGPNQHDLTGTLTYRVQMCLSSSPGLIMNDESLYATGTAQAGEDVTVPIEVETAGDYLFYVFVFDEEGNGSTHTRLPASGGIRIGETSAQFKPGDISYELQNQNTISLVWPEAGPLLAGGWIDESQVSYRVKRSDGEIVADGITERLFSETLELEAPTAVSYQVFLFYKGNRKSTLSSIKFPIGPPMELPWNNGTDFSTFGGNWSYSSNYAYPPSNSEGYWLYSPSLQMAKGVYKLTFEATTMRQTVPISVYFGDNIQPGSMTQIMNTTANTANNYQTFETYIQVDEPMAGYLGFNAHTEGGYRIRNISVAPFESIEAPGAVQDLTAEPATLGALQANVTMTAPSVNQINEPTTQALTKVELYRGDELINTFDAPELGATLSYVDNDVTTGYVTYKAIAYNEAGQSVPATTTTFFGVDIPVCPESLDISITGNDVTLTWPEVTQGANGEYVGHVKYFLTDPTMANELATDIEGTSYTFHNVDLSGEQGWLYLYVGARNESGTSAQVVRNDYIVVGTPRELPYHETFPARGNAVTLSEEGFIGAGSGTGWSVQKNNQDANGDNGLIYCAIGPFDDSHDDLFKLHLPLMDFSATENPVLIFHVKFQTQGLQPYFIDGYTGEWQPLGDVLKDSTWYCDGAWHKVEIPLPMAKGCSIGHIMFSNKSEGRSGGYIYLDDIKVYDLVNTMSVQIDAPAILDVEEPGEVTVTVTNDGPGTVGENGYTVELYLNDEPVEMQPVALARDESTALTFTVTPTVTDEGYDIRAVVNYVGDKRMEDNEAEAFIKVNLKQYPNVIDLDGSAADGQVSLDWNEPVQTGQVNMEVTEDCEGLTFGDAGGLGGFGSYCQTPPSTYTGIGKIGDWTVVNHPVSNTLGSSQFWPDNYTWQSDGEDDWKVFTFNSWIVFSRSYFNATDDRYNAHSGEQYFGSRGIYTAGLYELTGLHAIVSPKLTGSTQKLSFWAKFPLSSSSSSAEYDDDNQLYVGWTDAESLDDYFNVTFQYLDLFKTNLWQWEKKSYSLPEGATYFVILDGHYDNNAMNGNPIMLDDITYTAVVDTTLTLLGYNVYRDGALLAELRTEGNEAGYNVYRNGVLKAENVPAANYVDEPEEDGVYTYQVTAVYAEGESAPSNKVRIVFVKDTPTGVSNVDAGRHVVSRRYVNPAGMVSDTPFDGVNIVVTTLDDGTTRTTKVVR